MVNGHVLAVGDLDGDGRDETVAGFRGQEFQLHVFKSESEVGERRTRHVLDAGGIAAADGRIADLYGTGRPAVAFTGASTATLKIYSPR